MKHIFFLFILLSCNLQAQDALEFKSLNDALAIADQNSIQLQSGVQQILMAKWQKTAAYANTVNFQNPTSFSMVNNTALPVSFLPAEMFGGANGELAEVQLGQQYVSNISLAPQIDIINPQAWAQIKTAKIGEQVTAKQNVITKKNLYESIAAAYYNITNTQQQITVSEEYLVITDSLLQLIENRANEGLARQQDVNDARVNKLAIEHQLVQFELLLEQQYNQLKILCDIPLETSISVITESSEELSLEAQPTVSSDLLYQQALLQSSYAESQYKSQLLSYSPKVSLTSNFSWQHNSNNGFFSSQDSWIHSSYVGLRVSVPITPSPNQLMQTKYNKINYDMAVLNVQHAKLQDEITNEQLGIDHDKAVEQLKNAEAIYALKEDNYNKNLNLYQEGLLETDRLLLSLNDLLNSQLNIETAKISIEFANSKIDINNNIQ